MYRYVLLLAAPAMMTMVKAQEAQGMDDGFAKLKRQFLEVEVGNWRINETWVKKPQGAAYRYTIRKVK